MHLPLAVEVYLQDTHASCIFHTLRHHLYALTKCMTFAYRTRFSSTCQAPSAYSPLPQAAGSSQYPIASFLTHSTLHFASLSCLAFFAFFSLEKCSKSQRTVTGRRFHQYKWAIWAAQSVQGRARGGWPRGWAASCHRTTARNVASCNICELPAGRSICPEGEGATRSLLLYAAWHV